MATLTIASGKPKIQFVEDPAEHIEAVSQAENALKNTSKSRWVLEHQNQARQGLRSRAEENPLLANSVCADETRKFAACLTRKLQTHGLPNTCEALGRRRVLRWRGGRQNSEPSE
jgi:hypothetical protein